MSEPGNRGSALLGAAHLHQCAADCRLEDEADSSGAALSLSEVL